MRTLAVFFKIIVRTQLRQYSSLDVVLKTELFFKILR
jgi:hypothetical protein